MDTKFKQDLFGGIFAAVGAHVYQGIQDTHASKLAPLSGKIVKGLPTTGYMLGEALAALLGYVVHWKRESTRLGELGYGSFLWGRVNFFKEIGVNALSQATHPTGVGQFQIDTTFPSTNVVHGRPGPPWATTERMSWQNDLTW